MKHLNQIWQGCSPFKMLSDSSPPGWPLVKLCVTLPFFYIFRGQTGNQMNDYKLLAASSFCFLFQILSPDRFSILLKKAFQ